LFEDVKVGQPILPSQNAVQERVDGGTDDGEPDPPEQSCLQALLGLPDLSYCHEDLSAGRPGERGRREGAIEEEEGKKEEIKAFSLLLAAKWLPFSY